MGDPAHCTEVLQNARELLVKWKPAASIASRHWWVSFFLKVCVSLTNVWAERSPLRSIYELGPTCCELLGWLNGKGPRPTPQEGDERLLVPPAWRITLTGQLERWTEDTPRTHGMSGFPFPGGGGSIEHPKTGEGGFGKRAQLTGTINQSL